MAFVGGWVVLLCLSSITTVLSTDLEILKRLSEDLKGERSSWNTSDVNPCNWQGVQCNGVSVINITLSGMHLKGILSPTIGQLQSLNMLDLSKNGLFGEIPSNLSSCKSLSKLILSENRLSGLIPKDLSKLSSLQWLDLSGNAINGSIPEALGSLARLVHLDLTYNELTGTIPDSFGNLSVLEFLSLSQNSLEGNIPQAFTNLTLLQTLSAYQNNLFGLLPPLNWTSLQWVNLASNNLSGTIPTDICSSGALQVLILSNNAFNGTLPENLGACGALTNFRVGHNVLTGEIPATLGKLESLIYLDASQNHLTGPVPTGLSGCKSLALLNLASNTLVGTIPEDLVNVSTLQELHLANNDFRGIIPHGLSQCKLLNVLDLSKNKLEGGIPLDLCNSSKLVYLRLQENMLSGHIPTSIGDCRQLLELQLGDNSFDGTIPSTIGSLINLQVSLNLSINHLTGSIPNSIGTLSKLVSLDLSHNGLSGQIPSLVDMVSLVSWDFSYNLLTGPIPQVGSILNSSSSDYVSSYAHNSDLCGGPLPSCNADELKGQSKVLSFGQVAAISVASIIIALLIFSCITLAVWYKRHPSVSIDPTPSPMVSQVFVPHFSQAVNFESVKEALQTKGYLISSNHFSTMYKAIMPSGLILAAKKFHSAEKGLVLHYKKLAFDLDKLWRLSHENVMQPIGYLMQDNLAVLLYDFVPVCSLGQRLHKSPERTSLSWSMRHQVAIGAAQGLVFLHHACHPPMVHMDVNSDNIFLGHHFEVKVGDIEVAKLLDPTKNTGSVSAVAGSFGYIAPEYAFTMQVTLQSNVYSFGVILLELLTGRLPVDEGFGDGVDLVRWAHGASARGDTPEQILDSRISTESFVARQEMLAILKIALLCTDASPTQRPRMKKALELLVEAKTPAIAS
ncbi:hypothetical protein GOP47_0002460 [Adiantum capillus-veneris]|uniref:Protein kinase domain-containing protein n=1 Tax=Adiantum capillus-veneris TaxID=13818 RepID=A0A9D4ZR98_ADICA|nr:hypothetical protein GOP47_0002460 [Adiantum capillus-veneris]